MNEAVEKSIMKTIELPCSIGDIVYHILSSPPDGNKRRVNKCYVSSIRKKIHIDTEINFGVKGEVTGIFELSDIGTKIFLTREEAETAANT